MVEAGQLHVRGGYSHVTQEISQPEAYWEDIHPSVNTAHYTRYTHEQCEYTTKATLCILQHA